MKVTFLGGTDEIGASALLLECGGRRLLVDCGIRLGGKNPLPDLDLITEAGGIDAVLVTHGHLDHIGALPVVHRQFPHVPIYATAPTVALAAIMLRDAAKLMSQEETREEEIPLYSTKTVDSLINAMRPVQPGMPEEIAPGVTATWFLCGHIIGAASIGIESPEGRVLISGDVAWSDQLSVSGMQLPPFRPDHLILESTYGDRMHANRSRQEEDLVRQVAEIISQNGKVLIPAFAVGRAQEVLLILRRAMRLRRIPRFPVWVDGLVRPVCSLYVTYCSYLRPKLRALIERSGDPFFGDLEEIKPVEKIEDREEVLNGPPCAIVASSGMLSGGASVYYARRLVEDEKALITITGYQDEETPGRQLLAASEGKASSLNLAGQQFSIRCAIRRYHLSAHADAGELVGLAARLKPADTVLVHGEGASREALARQLASEPVGRIHLPRCGTTLLLAGRRRRFQTIEGGLGKGKPLQEGVAELAAYAYRLRGPHARWQVAQLQRLWGDSALQVEEAEKILVESGYFVRDPTRPFSLKVALPEEQRSPAGPPLAEILSLLGPESGLYRHSVNETEREVVLRFHFPKAAEAKYAKQLEALCKPAGWRCRIHPSPHTGMVVAKAKEVVERCGGRPVKTSLHLERDEVVVRTEEPLPREKAGEAAEQFHAETGLILTVRQAPSYCVPKQKVRPDGRFEINAAFLAIDEAFRKQAHRPYKKRLLGQNTIELVFISPMIGERYKDLIEQLSKQTGWPISIGSTANQHRIKEIAVTLATEYGLKLRKNPRYFGGNNLLVLLVEKPPEPEKAAELRRRFTEATGFELKVERE